MSMGMASLAEFSFPSMVIFDLGLLSLNISKPHLKLAPVMLWWDSGPCHGRATFLDPLGVPS